MISSVFGFAPFLRSRSAAAWLRLAALGVAALGALSPARALAQAPADPTDGGWFEPPPAPQPPPQPYYTDPRVDPPAAPAPEAEVADTDASALTTFKPTLDPYGAWVADANYGTVWVPHASAVGADFAPYVSRGHWALTADDDWIWVSDYPFGWAVFHYGRWVWISGHGWSWVPGRTYANAWVVWRVPSADYAYVGWAPMPPSWVWMNGSAISLWYAPPVPYVFCPSAYVFDRRVHYHIVHDHHLVHRIARHSYVHPTPYRAPATPTRHAATPGIRTAAIAPSTAPRGPRVSAARVPARAVPALRTAPPVRAASLSGARHAAGSAELTRSREPATEARLRSSAPAPERAPAAERPPLETRRPLRTERVQRATPRVSEPRTSAPSRLRVEPRPSAPARVHTPSPARDMVRTPPRSTRFRKP